MAPDVASVGVVAVTCDAPTDANGPCAADAALAPLPALAAKPAPPPAAASPPPAWSIPAVWVDAAAPLGAELSASELLGEGGGAVAGALVRAETLPSTQWTAATVAHLSSGLVQNRNRFVCMQLAAMAAEQLQKVAAARAAGDAAVLRAARGVFLSTLEAGGEVVGGALFYPRAASKAVGGAAGVGVFPHVYVELICINQPGQGYGSMLLQHVEAFALTHAHALLAAALDDAGLPPPPAAAACPPGCAACLRGVKLLSVESAQRFYSANGFSEPDGAKEMFKPLASVARRLRVA
ncbi:MAG: hypothetical protein J3K34DRAFT_520607 [Monoraphidium minutum]|nr:MAG: hypothetical protein J3K34DRAFT_520607 [Monoraphidium minutum]